jgi:YHS domain-containing protein
MIRTALIFIFLVILYYAVKTVVRSAIGAYHRDDGERRLRGEEMVLDPQCKTYVPKGRAVMRRVGGKTVPFCSEACARAYEEGEKRR